MIRDKYGELTEYGEQIYYWVNKQIDPLASKMFEDGMTPEEIASVFASEAKNIALREQLKRKLKRKKEDKETGD